MTHKTAIILMMATLVCSSGVLAQAPGGGPESGPRTDQQAPPFGGQPGRPGNGLAPPILDPAASISRQQALNLARDRFQGRVLSVRMDGSNWRVRIDQNGTVFNVFVDGRTGEVSRFAD